jgi:hypothetical protein
MGSVAAYIHGTYSEWVLLFPLHCHQQHQQQLAINNTLILFSRFFTSQDETDTTRFKSIFSRFVEYQLHSSTSSWRNTTYNYTYTTNIVTLLLIISSVSSKDAHHHHHHHH